MGKHKSEAANAASDAYPRAKKKSRTAPQGSEDVPSPVVAVDENKARKKRKRDAAPSEVEAALAEEEQVKSPKKKKKEHKSSEKSPEKKRDKKEKKKEKEEKKKKKRQEEVEDASEPESGVQVSKPKEKKSKKGKKTEIPVPAPESDDESTEEDDRERRKAEKKKKRRGNELEQELQKARDEDRSEMSSSANSFTTQMMSNAQKAANTETEEGGYAARSNIFMAAATAFLNRSDSDREETEIGKRVKAKAKRGKGGKRIETPEAGNTTTLNAGIPLPTPAPASTEDLKERWNVEELGGGSKRQDKFMRLLGGKKAGAASGPAAGPKVEASSRPKLDINKASQDLEQQFNAGVRMKFDAGGKRKGLGA